MTRRLAEVLGDVAEQAKLYDLTDNAIKVVRRRRRVRKTAVAMVTMVAVLVGVVAFVLPSGGPGRPEGGPGRLDGEPSSKVLPLLEAPTRGSLKDDVAFLDALLDRVVDNPSAFGLPGDRARLRVLFAGDLPGNRRVALVAGVTAAPRMVHLTASGKAAVKKLELTGWSDVEDPVVREEWRNDKNQGYALLFGPADYEVSVSEAPRYMDDGTIQRTWESEPTGYIVRDTSTLPRGLRVRMSRGDVVFYEAAVASPGTARAERIDPSPLYGRGKPAPRAAQVAADALAYSTGLVGPGIQYVVLWSDDFAVPDGVGQIATVMAVTEQGGGPYITIATDTSPEPNGRNHPTGAGVAGNPEHTVIAMRMPHFDDTAPDTLQIVAPPQAVRVDLLKGEEVLATVPLSNGLGRVELPGPLQLTVRALDAQGKVIAQRAFADLTGNQPSGGYEPEVHGW
ncbi:hypothetical protein GCM10009827_114410 [Dactylosporangium maewongense]|uniref:Uncharacterized protein n=1 Tax=Dactylosporangium maewongense TaxID=634393 RepID=A0ABP4P7A5_9ACTN